MDHVRLVRTELSFSAYTYEHHLAIPSYDLELLQDVRLQFWGEPAQLYPIFGVYPSDIRFYLGGIDVTKWIRGEVFTKLSAHRTTREEYAAGMAQKLDIARQMGDAYGNPDIDEEAAVVNRLSGVADISTLFAQFGERPDYGWGGAFHPFNFLFKSIMIQPISLAAVINEYNADNPESQLSPLDTASLRISTGPAGTVPGKLEVATGRVVVMAELRFHNTLRDQLEQMENEFKNLRDRILLELENISDSLGPNSELATAVADLENEVQVIRDDLGDSASELASQSQQLAAIKAAVSELKAAVAKL